MKSYFLCIPLSIQFNTNPLFSWYPPGHGDFYRAFAQSGLLQKFLDERRTYCFLSNIDNLGALVDLSKLSTL